MPDAETTERARPGNVGDGYVLFLSHNSRDKEHAQAIGEQLLDNHRVNCWLDVWSIPAAADWQAAIDKALDTCGGALIVLSAQGFGPIHAAEAHSILERRESSAEFVVVPLIITDAGQDGNTVLAQARTSSSNAAAQLDRLIEFFQIINYVVYPIGPQDEALAKKQEAALLKVMGALTGGGRAPHPIGPDVLTPIRIRRDARLWMLAGRHASHFYAGSKLAEALRQRASNSGQFDEVALSFLDGSQIHETRLRQARLRALVGTVVVLLVLLAAIAVLFKATRSALRRTEDSLWTAAGRNAALQASLRDERGALAEGLRAVLPGLDDDRVPAEGLRGLWLAVDASRKSYLLESRCEATAVPTLSSDGAWALFVDAQGRATLVDTTTYDSIHFDLGGTVATAVAMNPNAKELWFGTRKGAVWSAAIDGPAVERAQACAGRVTALAVVESDQIAVGCEHGGVVPYRVRGRALEAQPTITTNGPPITLVANARHLLAVGGTSSTLVELATGREVLMDVQLLLAGAIDQHERVVGVGIRRTIERCTIHEGRCVPLTELRVGDTNQEAVATGADGAWIVSAAERRILIWDALGNGELRVQVDTPHAYMITRVALAANARRALTVDLGGSCRLWRTDGDSAHAVLGTPHHDPMRPPFADLSQSAIIRSHLDNSSVIAVSGEGGNVISLHRDGQVRRWLNGRPKVLWTVPTKGDAASGCIGVKAAGLVSDGRLVIVGLEGELSGPWTEVPSLACTIEGEILAVTERAGSWRHYDLRTGHAVDQPLRRALFQVSMPDDAALPRALAGDLLSMWRLGSTDVLFALTHRGDIWLQTRRGWLELSYREFQFPKAFAMSPDGRFVAVGNELREVWVWFVDTGQLVLRLNGPNGPVSALAWTPDGELLVGSLDGTIRVYAASAGQLAAEACRLLREAPEDVARLCGQYWGK